MLPRGGSFWYTAGMPAADKDLYYVAVKLFLERAGALLILKDVHGGWDLPGGRLLRREFSVPLTRVVARKLREELGAALRYRLGEPKVFLRHQRREHVVGRPAVRIFAVGYQASFLGGSIKLSRRHSEFAWVPLRGLRPEQYFRGGWLTGVREYLALRRS